ncbi:MAG: hypothetical protein NTU44_12365 [Bacteroidetes bacterium]|nr:hypothetical protein [Bacteroidota bacterium]
MKRTYGQVTTTIEVATVNNRTCHGMSLRLPAAHCLLPGNVNNRTRYIVSLRLPTADWRLPTANFSVSASH